MTAPALAPPLSTAAAAAALDALGNPSRLEAFRLLVRAGRTGLAVHELQERLGGIPRSTLAHHLGKLLQAGLIDQERDGASVISRASYERMDRLIGFLTDQCCADERSTGVGAGAAR